MQGRLHGKLTPGMPRSVPTWLHKYRFVCPGQSKTCSPNLHFRKGFKMLSYVRSSNMFHLRAVPMLRCSATVLQGCSGHKHCSIDISAQYIDITIVLQQCWSLIHSRSLILGTLPHDCLTFQQCSNPLCHLSPLESPTRVHDCRIAVNGKGCTSQCMTVALQ